MLSKEEMAVELARIEWEIDGVLRSDGLTKVQIMEGIARVKGLVTYVREEHMTPRKRKTKGEGEKANVETAKQESFPEVGESDPQI